MEELKPGTQEYAEALTSPATTLCRVLLDRKSDGTIKSRIVVRGDLENIERTDGPGFNYYAVTASLPSIRLALFQSGRHVLQPGQTPADWLVMSSCDVTSAFCQSDKNDDGVKRFLKVHSPINHIWYYYAQYKPLYGSCSAPVRWQNTFASWITTTIEAGGPGFLRFLVLNELVLNELACETWMPLLRPETPLSAFTAGREACKAIVP